jgi:hypothetical protein
MDKAIKIAKKKIEGCKLTMNTTERIQYTLEHTEILYPPRQLLATFGPTTVYYYLLTKPVYSECIKNEDTVIREGKITWDQPRIITPYYMLSAEGFSKEAQEALKLLATQNPYIAGLLYKMTYKKDSEKMEIVSNSLMEVYKSLENNIEKRNDLLCTIIKGVDEFWDVSLSKFIYEMIIRSASFSQIPNLKERGLIEIDDLGYPIVTCNQSGTPLVAINEIERLFELAQKKELDPHILKKELDKWGMFKMYEDRFFELFTRKK